MTCGACKHWRPSPQQGLQGYGTCDVRPGLLALRVAHLTSAQCVCRVQRFIPIQPKEQ